MAVTQKVVTVNSGGTAVPPSGLTRPGYTFDSWNMKADGTGETAILANVTQNMVVYAKWTVDTEPEPEPEPVKIVCLGNSLTAGHPYTQDRPAESEDIYSWTHTLRTLSNYKVINKGISGNTSAMMLARFNTDVLALSPDYCIIECGTNDGNRTDEHNLPLQTCLSNIQQLVDLCMTNNITPILAHYSEQVSQLVNYGLSNADAVYLHDYTESVKNFESTLGYTFIDFTPTVVNNGVVDTSKFSSDYIHPNTSGYQVWGTYAYSQIPNLT